jgi:hypothetical protein
MERRIHPNLLQRKVDIHLVGCGGNGSQMLTELPRLEVALSALGTRGCASSPGMRMT